jgi:hypothetical protein
MLDAADLALIEISSTDHVVHKLLAHIREMQKEHQLALADLRVEHRRERLIATEEKKP